MIILLLILSECCMFCFGFVNDFNVDQNLLFLGPCWMIFVFSVSICRLICVIFLWMALLSSSICFLLSVELFLDCSCLRCLRDLISLRM